VAGVSTSDRFFPASTVKVRQAKRLCAPVNKNGEDPTAPTHPGHETFYTIKQTAPKFERKKDIPITVANTFGGQSFPNLTVDLVRADRMLVPTSKALTGPNFPPPLSVNLDHFKCYRVRGARFRRSNVSVETQFGSLTVAIKRPRDLCVPVDKNGEGIFNGALGLMCFQVRTTPQTSKHVFTNNQFEQDAYDIFGVRDLCVPAFIDPKCGDDVVGPGEVCDGSADAACPGRCNGTCTCDPFCGDDEVNQQTEACDGTDDGACPGACSATCTCGPICGDGALDLGEDCDGDTPTCPQNANEICTDQCGCDCEPFSAAECPADACGSLADGCGGQPVDCGTCSGTDVCGLDVANQCGACHQPGGACTISNFIQACCHAPDGSVGCFFPTGDPNNGECFQ